MSESEPQAPSGAGVGGNTYQLTLAGLGPPGRAHYAFDAVAGLCVAMLGHPWFGLVFFLSSSAVDTVNQSFIGRWLRESAGTDPDQGFRKLAALCSARMVVYLAPTLTLAMLFGLK